MFSAALIYSIIVTSHLLHYLYSFQIVHLIYTSRSLPARDCQRTSFPPVLFARIHVQMRLSANLTSLTSSILAFSSHLVPGAPSNTTALGRRSVSEYLGPLVLRVSRRQEQIRMASQRSQDDVEKLNVLGGELQQHGINPTTGFFRDGSAMQIFGQTPFY